MRKHRGKRKREREGEQGVAGQQSFFMDYSSSDDSLDRSAHPAPALELRERGAWCESDKPADNNVAADGARQASGSARAESKM